MSDMNTSNENAIRLSNLRVLLHKVESAIKTNRDSGQTWVDRRDLQLLREFEKQLSTHETCEEPQPVALVGYINEMPDIIYPGTTRLEGRRYLPIWRLEDHPVARRDVAKAEKHAQKAAAETSEQFQCRKCGSSDVMPWPTAPKASAETCASHAGPYCPETREPCNRMCQSLCNRRAGEATEHRPENIDCAICNAELPLSMIEMGGRLCPTCAGMPAKKASEYRCLVAKCEKPALVTPDGAVGGLCEEHNGNVGLRDSQGKLP